MKATLEFNLPEEEWQFRCAANAQRMDELLHLVHQLARNAQKYGRPTDEAIDEIYRLTGEYTVLQDSP